MPIEFAVCFHHSDMKGLSWHALSCLYVRFHLAIRCLLAAWCLKRNPWSRALYTVVATPYTVNCSLSVLLPLAWYSKGLAHTVEPLKVRAAICCPKGVLMPLLNCGSPSEGLPLHWYCATTNFQLIASGKNVVHRFHHFEVITKQPTYLWGKTLVGIHVNGGHSSRLYITILKFSVGLDWIISYGRLCW